MISGQENKVSQHLWRKLNEWLLDFKIKVCTGQWFSSFLSTPSCPSSINALYNAAVQSQGKCDCQSSEATQDHGGEKIEGKLQKKKKKGRVVKKEVH